MQPLALFITTAPIKPQNRRKELIKAFVDNIQRCARESQQEAKLLEHRTGIKQKMYPIPSPRLIAIKLGHLKEIHDLEYYLGCCKEAKHFARYFHSQLKVDTK